MTTKVRNGSKTAVRGIIITLACTALFVLFLFNRTTSDAEVWVVENKILIKGQYGVTYRIADVTDLQLAETMPAVLKKVDGAWLKQAKKGDFDIEGMGVCRLFVQSDKGPFIYLKVKDKYTIINFNDATKTKNIYAELKGIFYGEQQ